jgi:thioredoxin reductase/Pyruvate/2-oxoacid:ferredoxin oxidoreductase delta subunit
MPVFDNPGVSSAVWLYALPLLVIFIVYGWRRYRRGKVSIKKLRESVEAGLTEPSSLHPVVDHVLCLGCSSCVKACPEKDVLGIIHGKAQLINPTHCIGHGACKTACPFDAIELVFGTEKRGVDIPTVNPNFQTNVPGIFIAGELGGMGLIRNAIAQGSQAVEAISRLDGIGKHGNNSDEYDLVVVGAGPAGIAASLAAMERKLKCVTLEQDSLGGTVAHYPRGKIVMTAPAILPIVGKMRFRETTKEILLAFWQDIEARTGLKVNYNERVENVEKIKGGFVVKTASNAYRCHAVLLAIGRRGTPRTLGAPGEEQSKVVYRMIDPQQYRDRHVLVVGGGDSALEAATSIAQESGTTVSLSYRSEAFARAKQKNRDKVEAARKSGRLNVMMKSTVKQIDHDTITIDHDGEKKILPNNDVIICAGGILPTPFLKQIGIEVETRHGEAS